MSRAGHAIRWLLGFALVVLAAASAPADLPEQNRDPDRPLSLVLRDVPLAEVFEMLSRTEQVNILLGKGVTGNVSVNLFEVRLDQAIRSIAESAGYVAERRRGSYVIIDRKEAGKDAADGNTVIQTFKVQYTDAKSVSEILARHLSRYGDIMVLETRGLLVVEDLPDFVERLERLLAELDREPRQILIEAKILEITLDETETLGIDWSKALTVGDGSGNFGVRGLVTPASPGFFFDLLTPNIEVMLDALNARGRVRTLSTPTLLALEHQEAEVVIGDRLGFRVTTTINEVTTESVEFLESGVILKFTAAVDRFGRIVLSIHPEVSTGTISDGLPAQTTTEVTTKLITDDGQKVFIGGLMKDRSSQHRTGVPFLSDLPLLGRLFSRSERIDVSTETVVVLTAHLVGERARPESRDAVERMSDVEDDLEARRRAIERAVESLPPGSEALPAAPPPGP